MNRYLTQEQLNKLKRFMKLQGVRNTELAEILSLAHPSTITYYFKNNRFRCSDFETVRKSLKERALENFYLIDFENEKNKS